MALDAYSPCLCGSGKKFKWCCQPIHAQIEKAFRQEGEGQHEVALRLIDELIAEHPANPEPLGRKAQLLFQNDRLDDAEAVLEKAFAINPNYAFGFLLRGMCRQNEGELEGALTLFRKAAELYDPEAKDILGQVYTWIGECEFRLNNPVAAHAAVKLALHCDPANQQLREAIEGMYGPESVLPAAARKQYDFHKPVRTVDPKHHEIWEGLLLRDRIKLSDAVRIFEQLTAEAGDDPSAWYNLGLARAWLGNNRGAIEALDRYVHLEKDEAKAVEAWTLAEVLRHGVGMDDLADNLEHSVLFQIRDHAKFSEALHQLQSEKLFGAVSVNQEQGLITGMLFEKKPSLTPQSAQLVGLGSYLLILVDHLRLWHTNRERLAEAEAEVMRVAGPALSEARRESKVATFNDLLAEMLSFPMGYTDKEEAEKKINEYANVFFEEKWLERPLKALEGSSPANAARQPGLRAKLLGVIQFLQDCAGRVQMPSYDFNRLRRKLGLIEGGSAEAASAGPDITALGAGELAGLPVGDLDEAQLEKAFQTAMKHDARDLAGKFAQALVDRPPVSGRGRDKYPWFAHLIGLAQAAGNLDAALGHVDAGEKSDCEENEGRRRNDYELRRGQLHARRGDIDSAADVFERLAQRSGEVKHWGAAAEAMISAKQGGRAAHFADKGLAAARAKNDRDSENYLLELQDAAKRMGG